MSKMIDPKDLEDILARYRNINFQAHALKEELRELLPDTPKQGEAWLVSTREGEQREALKAGNRWYVKDGDYVEAWVEEALTPIARLVPEVDPTPAILATEDDYDNANPGTVVKDTSSRATPTYEKGWNGTWNVTGNRYNYLSSDMALVARTVLYSSEEETAN